MGWPAFLAAEEDFRGVVGEDCHDDGGVGAGEGEVGYPLSGCAWWTFGWCCWCSAADCAGAGYRCHVSGGTGALHAAVDGEGRLAALGAERVAIVPVDESTGLGVDGGGGCREVHVHAAFDKGEAFGFFTFDEGFGGCFDGAFGCNVKGKEGCALIDSVFKTRLVVFI